MMHPLQLPHGPAHTITITQANNGWIVVTLEAPRPPAQERLAAAAKEVKQWDDEMTEKRLVRAMEKMADRINPPEVLGYAGPPAPKVHVALNAVDAIAHLQRELGRLEIGDEIDQQIRAAMGKGAS